MGIDVHHGVRKRGVASRPVVSFSIPIWTPSDRTVQHRNE
jgi:hypothetical protein